MTSPAENQPQNASTGEAPRRHLGRGLNALFGDEDNKPPPADAQQVPNRLPIEHLRPGKYQPRGEIDVDALGELVESIRDKGILQPLLVRPDPQQQGRYEIIAGERRWRAAQMAQVHEVPVVIRDLTDQQALEIALVENLQRQDLSALDEALGYRRLMDEFSHTQEGLAKAVGKSRSHVANTLRLLSLPEPVKAMLAGGSLSAGHARTLLGAEDALALANEIVRKGMSVRQAEQLVAKGRTASRRPRAAKAKDPDTKQLEDNVSAILGTAVTIQSSGEGGKLVIRYDSLEQLETMLTRLTEAGTVTADPPQGDREAVASTADADDADMPAQMPGDRKVGPAGEGPDPASIPDWAEEDAEALLSQIEAMFGDDAEPDDAASAGPAPQPVSPETASGEDEEDSDLDTPFTAADSEGAEPEMDDETERFLKELEQIVGPIPDDDDEGSRQG